MGNRIAFTVAMPVLFVLALNSSVLASDDDLAVAGRLYDKWWKEAGLKEPKSTHPAYPKAGKKSGSATWRCKECHGWDYRGKDGAYASGSHFTGIKGIQDMKGKSEDQVKKILGNSLHAYVDKMDEETLEQLAEFVARGQIDMDQFIDRKSKKARGSKSRGKVLYADYCESCHGADGRNYNFKAKAGKEEYLGTISNKNPWETLHKIVNGHPGASGNHHMGRGDGMGQGMHHGKGRGRMWMFMPAMRDRVKSSEWGDVLAYLQSLPK